MQELEKLISAVYSAAERDIYIHTVAKKFGVDFISIKNDVERIISKRAAAYKRGQTQRLRQESVGYADRINPDFIKNPTIARNEETVLGLLLLFPEHRKRVFEESLLTEDDFVTSLNKRIFAFLAIAYKSGDEHLIAMNSEFTPEEMGRISRMKIARMQLDSSGTDILTECIDTLKKSVDKKAAEKTDTIDKLNEILSKKRTD